MADIDYDVDAALAEVPVNIFPLTDDTDFKSIEGAVAFDAAGMALFWHFVTTAGAYTVTAVTPTAAGNYDWTDQGTAGIYTIEIPASGGASINNDTEGFGWFTGVATGVLPWRGPICRFRASGLNDLLTDSAFSATRGLAGSALPAAAADAAGGLVISDAGGLDADAQRADVAAILVDTGTTLDDFLDTEVAAILAAVDTEIAAIKVVTDAMAQSVKTIVEGTCAALGTTTAVIASALSPTSAVNDQFNGRVLIFAEDTTTAALRGQATAITDYVHATLTFTVTALTTAPASGDTFVIL